MYCNRKRQEIEAGVTYDSKSYTVKVKVTDNGQGQLEATVTD
ncbi:Spy0128 family protein, partial [Gemella haemolysans]